MANENVQQKQYTPRDKIRIRVIRLEKENYALKPEGKRDSEMIESIKRIIEQEIGK